MDGRSFAYVVESGDLDSARETVEGALKPEADVSLAEGEVIARTIAAWRKLRRQELADLDGLQAMIGSRLLYLIARRIEAQVLGGTGTGENLRGILNSGIPISPHDAALPLADLILRGVTVVRRANANPGAIVISPGVHEAMLIEKSQDSGNRLDSAGAFRVDGNTLWGVPLVVTPLIEDHTALVGDFEIGCQLFYREGLSLRISDNDQDDFVKNQVTILGECRVGFATFQPTAFCNVRLVPTPLGEEAHSPDAPAHPRRART
jgi:HK97 family phage major capsid protein